MRRARARRRAPRQASPATSSSSTTTLPERFGERAGDEVAFQVLVKEAKRKVLPELTDEWVVRGQRVRHRRRRCATTSRTRLDLVRARCRRRWPCATRCSRPPPSSSTIEVPDAARQPGDGAPPPRPRAPARGRRASTIPQYLAATGQEQEEFVAQLRETAHARRCAPTSRCARSSPRRRSRRPTTRSTPRSSGWPSGSARSPRRSARISNSGARRGGTLGYRPRARRCEFLVDHATVVDEDGNPVDLTLPEDEPDERTSLGRPRDQPSN